MNSSDKPNNLISLPTWFSDEKCKELISWLDSLTIQEVEDLKSLQAENEILQSQLNIALEALKSAKVHSECYEELILIIDQALEKIGGEK